MRVLAGFVVGYGRSCWGGGTIEEMRWHKSRTLEVPENVSILFLPPYSPELNSIERLWGYLCSQHLSDRVYENYQRLLDAGAQVWQQLTPERVRAVCACP